MSKTDKTPTQPDLLPETLDDGDMPAVENASQETQDSGEAPAAKAEAKPEPPEDPRAAIARRYRENRDRANAAESGDESAVETDDATPEPAAPVAVPAAKAAPEPVAKAEDEFTLIVDGREVKKTASEIRALAQITLAGDNRLDEAKRLLKEAQAVRGQPRETEHQPAPGTEQNTQQQDRSQGKSGGEHQPKRDLNPEKLKGIVERIQVGDTEEGTQALQDLIEVVRGSDDMNPAKVGEMVQSHLVRQQTQAEIDAALANFSKEYPDLAKDEILADAGRSVLRQELIKDLKAVGADEAEIEKIKHDPRALASAQRNLRVAGHSVRSYADILGAVGKTMTERFNLKPASAQTETPAPNPKPQPTRDVVSQERLDRKRQAPQQPRTAGVRGQIAPAPQPKTKKDVVAEMRAARGFTKIS